MNRPIHLLSGIQSLTINKLEQKLSDEEIIFFNNKKWNKRAVKTGVFFDLSQVIWVNIGAAFQLCLLIENAKKNNIQVYISLPIRDLTTSESESTNYSESIKTSRLNSRQKANDFLKVIQFDKAVLCEHIKSNTTVRISEDYQFSKEFSLEHFKDVFSEAASSLYTPLSEYHNFNYKYILPLTWINQENNSLEDISDKIKSVLMDENRGLHHLDILSLKNVILYELLKNIREHAGAQTEHALFCIGLINSKSISIENSEKQIITHSNNIEKDFLEGIVKSNISSVVEIYFGDSGDGICSKSLNQNFNENHSSEDQINNLDDPINQKSLIRWSFDKWSTRKNEKIRGTKGLYRIQRIVNKYNGIIHIRTGRVNGGFQKGGKPIPTWTTNKSAQLFHQPGTSIQIKLSPYKEILKYNLQTNISLNKKKWQSIIYEIDTVRDKTIDSFSKWINQQSDSERFDNTLIIFKSINKTNDKAIVEFLEDCLKFLSEFRHPLGILVYVAINLGKETLRGIVESTNDLIIKETGNTRYPESEKPQTETVYDPVLVIGEDNSLFWYGGNQKIIEILNKIYLDGEKPKKIKDLNLSSLNQRDALIFFQNDSNFFQIDKNENLYFNFTNLKSLFLDILNDSVKEGTISYDGKKVCSPKLDLGENWLSMKTILDENNSTGFALVLYMLLSENQLIKNVFDKKKTYLFIDHSQQLFLAKELSRIIGISQKNIIDLTEDIDLELPRRTKLFNSNDNVIILTTLISSSETIRRLVKHIQRDNANTICVLCLLNNRKYNIDSLKTWKKETKIISLFQKYEENKKGDKPSRSKQLKKIYKDLKKDIIVYSPSYELVKNQKDEISISKELIQLFKRTNCLHYDHLGKYNERHYTFYLDKEKILKDDFIVGKIKKKIESWIDSKSIEKFNVLIPEKNNAPLSKCLNILKQDFNINEIIEINNYQASEHIYKDTLFIDFGSLTGKTLDKVIASNPATENLLILTVFSQFKEEKNIFYKKIKSTEVEYTIQSNQNYQMSIFSDFIKETPIKKAANISVSFEFIYNLPIYFYHSIHCPICQHNEALDSFQLSNVEYMEAFSKDRKDKLKIKDSDILPKTPVDFYYSKQSINHHEISSELIVGMYKVKQLLENSLINTEHRIQLFKELYKLYIHFEDEIKNPDSLIYSVMYFLSHEVIWMQKEPLIYQNFRYLLTYFSREISVITLHDLITAFNVHYKNLDKSQKVATRFKYSAISLFRSSNKYEYCENIFFIIKASVYKSQISNNLLQNSLYHINSLHVNTYNNTDVFYKEIENQLEKLINSELIVNENQLKALNTILFNNKVLLRRSKNSALSSQIEIFKNLKKDVFKEYKNTTHPYPAKFFSQLDLRLWGSKPTLLEDIIENGEESFFLNHLRKHKEGNLLMNWNKTKEFIELSIINYLELFDSKIKQSNTFKSIFNDLIQYKNIKNHFEEQINRGSKNILEITEDSINYHSNYDFINTAFIRFQRSSALINNNSKLLMLLEDIPVNLSSILINTFSKSLFPKIAYEIPDSRSFKGFFSKSLLATHLNHILKNIDEKSSDDISLEDIDITISIKKESEYIISKISYNQTNNHIDIPHPQGGGGLKQFNDDLIALGGNLEYLLDKKTGLFNITIKIKNYGNN